MDQRRDSFLRQRRTERSVSNHSRGLEPLTHSRRLTPWLSHFALPLKQRYYIIMPLPRRRAYACPMPRTLSPHFQPHSSMTLPYWPFDSEGPMCDGISMEYITIHDVTKEFHSKIFATADTLHSETPSSYHRSIQRLEDCLVVKGMPMNAFSQRSLIRVS